MKNIYLIAAVAVVIFYTSACKTTRTPQIVKEVHTDTLTLTTREVIKDTTFIVAPDSALAEAYFICDSDNHVLLSSLIALQGQVAHIKQQAHNHGQGLKMIFECKCDSQAIYKQWIERDTLISRRAVDLIPVVKEIPAPLTWWQSTAIKFFPYTLGFTALVLVLLILWLINRFTSVKIPLL